MHMFDAVAKSTIFAAVLELYNFVQSIYRPSTSIFAKTRCIAIQRTRCPDPTDRSAQLFDCLTAWLAPILCFTAEEAWLQRNPGDNQSVHLRTFPEIPGTWRNEDVSAKWEKIREIRRVVLGALEIERAEKRIGSSLQAAPTVYMTPAHAAAFEGVDLAEVAITSGAVIETGTPPANAFTLPDLPDLAVVPTKADGHKCERCWKV